MATLRPPSTSPSPSPAPGGNPNGRNPNARASMGPLAANRIPSGNAPAGLGPSSPRPSGIGGAGRPTSELLGTPGLFQTPEAEAIDQWFENLQNYEATLEEMAAASLDINFKEELSAIEQWFRVLSEAERTAALYSLLQHSTQVQIRFFITVLQQMARSDPMTALLSPSVGGSMQSQMEAKLNSMGLKSPPLSSPAARNFSGNRQSLAVESPSNSFLSPDAASLISPGGPSNGSEAAAKLAQQRAKLKANAAHRISAPGTLVAAAEGNRNVWSQGASQLGQLVESSASPSNEDVDTSGPVAPPSAGRPKSTDFAGVANTFLRRSTGAGNNSAGSDGNNNSEELSPMVGGNWASMVNTPLVPMFASQGAEAGGAAQTIDAVTNRLSSWSMSNSNGGKMQLEDAKKYRRASKSVASDAGNGVVGNADVYDENGNLVAPNVPQPGQRNVSGGSAAGGTRNFSGTSPNSNFLSAAGQWGGSAAGGGGGGRSPGGYSNVSGNSGRFGAGSDDGSLSQMGYGGGSPGMNGLGMGFPAGMNMNMNMLNAMNMAGMGGMNGMAGMGMGGMGLHPDVQNMQTQLLAAQLAAANGVFNPALFGMQGLGGLNGLSAGGRMPNNNRTGGGRSPGGGNKSSSGRESSSNNANKDSGGGGEDVVDPKLLEDIPAWLRSLRLHKYTPNFSGMNWRDMVIMDESALEAKGVAALGARRKMLKTFETVRAKMGIEMEDAPTIPA